MPAGVAISGSCIAAPTHPVSLAILSASSLPATPLCPLTHINFRGIRPSSCGSSSIHDLAGSNTPRSGLLNEQDHAVLQYTHGETLESCKENIQVPEGHHQYSISTRRKKPQPREEIATGAIAGYPDSAYMDDKADRHSTMAYVFFCAGSLVSWCSKKQQTVALSTTEAEYLAGTEATKEAILLQEFTKALGISKDLLYPAKFYGDNQSANALAHNPEYHSRTKHIHGKQRPITEMVEQRVIEVTYIPTRDMVADMLTKALQKDAYWRFVRMLGLKTMVKEQIMVKLEIKHRCRGCEQKFKSRNKLHRHLKEKGHEQ